MPTLAPSNGAGFWAWETEKTMAIYIRFNAGNDTNGNPRRVFVVFNPRGTIVETLDEGYVGNHEVRAKYPKHKDGGTFETTPKEYRNLVKIGVNK